MVYVTVGCPSVCLSHSSSGQDPVGLLASVQCAVYNERGTQVAVLMFVFHGKPGLIGNQPQQYKFTVYNLTPLLFNGKIRHPSTEFVTGDNGGDPLHL